MLQLGPITLDFTQFLAAAAGNPLAVAWFMFIRGGWIVILIALLIGFKWWWLLHITRKKQNEWSWVLLAVDVPRENIQTPRAVENIMAHLAGAHTTANFIQKYFTGHAQPFFSLEIASINGFIRFFVYSTIKNRDLAEAAIYAQYPAAEITEVEDYTKDAPTHFPDAQWDMWGTEFILAKHFAYPIRTWEDFHDETSEEATYKDPMAALLETMSSLREGEQLWLQLIITPIKSRSWQEECYRVVEKLAGIPSEHKPSVLDRVLTIPGHVGAMIIDAFLPGNPEHTAKIKEELPSKMLYLTPGEREVIQALEDKAAKLGFHTKIRAVYLARHEIFSKPRAVYGLIGAIKQLNTEDMNSLKPELKKVGTHTKYLWKEMRKNWRKVKVMRAYKFRSNWRGMRGYILNVEELATIWHFPVAESVKTPLVKKAESKRGEPPYELPSPASPHHRPRAAQSEVRGETPDNLPVG
ncbi:hypothetical protein HYW17_05145 [Candidatus Uhrbacteria bacterium]|nr:hypothetical protein [Candidatus Uhrbacteria bacterium]